MKKNTLPPMLRQPWLHTKTLFMLLFAAFCMLSNDVFAQTPMHQMVSLGTASNNVFPFGSTTSNRVQWLYYPSEFTPPVATGLITKVYFKVWTSSRGSTSYTDLDVLIGSTAQTGLTTTYVTGMQTCYSSPTTTFPSQVAGDWMEITLQVPYLWDTTENLVVEVRHQGYTLATNVVHFTGLSTNRRAYGPGTLPYGPNATSVGTNHAELAIDMMPATPCSGQVNAGVANSTQANACGNVPFNLSLSGHTNATGVTYQWQSSPAGANNFTDIPGANSAFYTVNNQTAATDYRCVLVCTNSNSTDTSTVVSVGQNPFTNCYCIPPYSTGCATYNLNSFILEGEGTSEIRDMNTGCNNDDGPGYSQRMSLFSPVDLLQDASYPVQINTTSTIPASTRASIWIDFNNDGFFDDATERLMDEMPLETSPLFANALIDFPYDAPPGVHRMRVRVVYSTTGYDACSSATWGETHDYDVNVIAVTCYRPLEIELTDIKKNGVDVLVTDNPNNAGSVNYFYEVRESGAPGSGPTGLAASGLATTNPFTITGLQPLTTYSVYVLTVCSISYSSSWTNEEEFTTLCNYPDLIAAPDVTVCGAQEVELTAIFDSGTVYWFDAEENGNLLHTGAVYRTPYLDENTTTSYWVIAGDTLAGGGGASASVGPVDNTIGATANYTAMNHWQLFTVHTQTTIQSVDVFATGAGVVDVYIQDTSGVTLFSHSITIPAGGKQTLVLNQPLPPGDYRMAGSPVNHAGGLQRNSSGASYPYVSTDGSITITGNSFSTDSYYFFYNWQIGAGGIGGCSSVMKEVSVTVLPKPEFELSTDQVTSCGGAASELVTVSTNLGGYDTFVWSPSTGVSGDAVNGWTFSTSQEQEYTLTAGQSTGICEYIKTVTVFSGTTSVPNPNLDVVQDVCKNTVTELTVLEDIINEVNIGDFLVFAAPDEISAFVHEGQYSKQQFIYGATDLINLGVDTPGFITGIDFNTINSGASFDNANYTIRLKAHNNTSFASDAFVTGDFTTVYKRDVHTHTFQGWQRFDLDNPFYWDGQSNIIVEITQEGVGAMNNAQTYVTSVPGHNVGLYAVLDSIGKPIPTSGLLTTSRLDVKFSFEQSEVTWSPQTNLYVDSAATIPYTGQNSLTVYHTSSTSGTSVYTATMTAPSGCSATQDYTLNIIDVGVPVIQNQTFCGSVPVSNLVVSGVPGAQYYYYSSPTSSTALTTITQSGTYYVEAGQGDCKSPRVGFTVTITTVATPTISQFTQVFCGSATVADLSATVVNGAQLEWYSSATSTTPLASTHALTPNTTYYASQKLNGCSSDRVAVLVNINQAPAPLVSQTLSICGGMTYDAANLNQLGGASLVWYPSSTSQQPIPGTNQISSGTYYVSQKVNGCESTRVQITVTIQPGTVPAPTPNTVQTICGSGTVADLMAQTSQGGVPVWYNSANSTTPLSPTQALTSGTYYVAQQIGNCLSIKVPVAVRIVNVTMPSISSFSLCQGATVEDLVLPTPTGTSYNWYYNSTSTTPLDPTDLLTSGYYFVVRVQDGCESTRVQVQVTVNPRPSSPTGSLLQDFENYAEVDDLKMDQPNVVWYQTYEDALSGLNPLVSNMPLVHGTTYYAVIIGPNGCPSLPTAVMVTITLGANDFDLTQLSYYPNPTTDLLTISYKEPIVQVEVYDLNGRQVITKEFDSDTVELDLTNLSSGTYMLNVKTKDSSQFVKVVRK